MGIRLLSILLLAFFISHEAVSIQSAVSDTKEKTLPSLVGIAHVAFRVSDVAKSRAFYQKLGFEQSFEFNDLGNPPVSYIKVNDHQFIELYQRKDDSQPIGLMHLCYETNDIEALQKEYVERGVKAPEPKKARAGNMLFIIHDPADQVLEFTQYMPGSLHYQDRGKHLGAAQGIMHIESVLVGIQDLAKSRALYATKLGFEDSGGQGVITLRLPGSSGQQIGLESNNPLPMPRIAFSVTNAGRIVNDLRQRGVVFDQESSVSDPDGAIVMFTERKEQKNARH